MDWSGDFDWEQSVTVDQIFDTNGNILDAPSETSSGPPEDHGGCVVGDEGLRTVQAAYILNGSPSQMANNSALINGHCMGSYAQAVGVTLDVATSSAQRQHTHDGVIQEKRKALTDGKSEQTKRGRAPNWTEKETKALLKWKLAVLMDMDITGKPVKSWSKDVSKHLFEEYGFDRSFTSCQQRWDSLLKHYNAIREHDSKIHLGASNCVRFWKMDEEERSKYKTLPKVFSWRWYVLMKNIILVEADNEVVKKSSRRRRGTRSIQLDANIASTITDPSSSQDQVPTIPPLASLSNIIPSTQGSQQPEGVAFKGVPDATVDEDDLLASITPFISKQIEVALQPLNSALRLVLANSMGNAIPYRALPGVPNLDVETSLAHGQHANCHLSSNEVVHQSTENADRMHNAYAQPGVASLNVESSLAHGKEHANYIHPANIEAFSFLQDRTNF